MTKRILLAVLAALVIGALWFLSRQSLDLDSLRDTLASLDDWRAQNPWTLAALFFATYVVVTALSLPIAVWLTLAGGALFGFWLGLVLVSFASSLGATLAFLTARFIARDWVRARFGGRLKVVDDGLARDGAFYLFTLRLIPVLPFFVVNLLMGLTVLRPIVFYAISQAGMLPATAVYVNAGTQLAQVQALSDIVSPGLLASFALLGVFPWIARALVKLLRRA